MHCQSCCLHPLLTHLQSVSLPWNYKDFISEKSEWRSNSLWGRVIKWWMKIVKVIEKEDKQKFHYKLPAALWENKEVLTRQRPFQSPPLLLLHPHTLTMWDTFLTVYYHRPPSKNHIFCVWSRIWQSSLCFKHLFYFERLRVGDSFYTYLGYFHIILFILGQNKFSIFKVKGHLCDCCILWEWTKGCSPQIDFFSFGFSLHNLMWF